MFDRQRAGPASECLYVGPHSQDAARLLRFWVKHDLTDLLCAPTALGNASGPDQGLIPSGNINNRETSDNRLRFRHRAKRSGSVGCNDRRLLAKDATPEDPNTGGLGLPNDSVRSLTDFRPITIRNVAHRTVVKRNQIPRHLCSSYPLAATSGQADGATLESIQRLVASQVDENIYGPFHTPRSISSSSSRLKIFASFGSSSWTTLDIMRRLRSMMAEIFSSRVPSVTSLKTCTARFWPRR